MKDAAPGFDTPVGIDAADASALLTTAHHLDLCARRTEAAGQPGLDLA